MTLVIPDIRLLQNLAYSLLLVFVKVDWRVLNQAVVVLGGNLWTMTALSYRRCTQGARADADKAAAAADRALARWGTAVTWVAFVMPLPYGMTRLAWALGIPLAIDQDVAANPLTTRIGEAGLRTLAIGGGILTLGLIRPWGGIWPRWIPSLAGRRIPVAVPSLLGGLVAIVVTVGGFSFVRLVLINAMGLAPEPAAPPTTTGWATWAPGWLWPFWGIALGMATTAYYHRRRDRGGLHDQGRPC